MASRVEEAQRQGHEAEVRWYGGETRRVRWLTGIAWWHTAGERPLPIRWVLVVNPDGEPEPGAFFCTCLAGEPAPIIMAFGLRWNVEVTFAESRRHLGVETQRPWSDGAIARPTPALVGLFSLVCLMAYSLPAGAALRPHSTAWYFKIEATFSDGLAFVRRAIWAGKYFSISRAQGDPVLFPRQDWETLLDQLAATA